MGLRGSAAPLARVRHVEQRGHSLRCLVLAIVRGRPLWAWAAGGGACTPAHAHTPRAPPPPTDPAGAYDAQDFAKAHAKELGMKTVPSLNVVFTEEKG